MQHGIKTIAFPCISTGAYRFPFERATRIAVSEVGEFLEREKSIEKIIFVCFLKGDYEGYQKVLGNRT